MEVPVVTPKVEKVKKASYVILEPTRPREAAVYVEEPKIKKEKQVFEKKVKKDKKFQPKKIVLAPRAANKDPIILSSWRRSETLTKYDEQKIQDYVSRNLGKSPEPLAR